MQKIKIKRLGVLFIIAIMFVVVVKQIQAQTLFKEFSQSHSSVVTATVGSYHLSVTGYQSPFASIILKTQSGTFLVSTTADSKGYFSISNTLINTSVLTYCFQAVDFKRIGLSEACITLNGPIIQDVTYNNIFLPPTIALSKKQIRAGQDAIIFGYSMPGAKVDINIEGKTITVTADNTGYYTYTYKSVPEGVFRITAAAQFNNEKSLPPTNNVTLEALSIPQQITNIAKEVTTSVKKKTPFSLLPYLLTALAFLIAIGVLLYKLRFRLWVIFVDFFRRRKKMHHDWFLDKW